MANIVTLTDAFKTLHEGCAHARGGFSPRYVVLCQPCAQDIRILLDRWASHPAPADLEPAGPNGDLV